MPSDVSAIDRAIIEAVRPFTLTSNERLISLINAVRFITRNRIPGAIAECGVWKGGSIMAAALTLLDEGDGERELYLYDTFDGMTKPTEEDISYDGVSAEEQLKNTPVGEGVWCVSKLEEVEANIKRTEYPWDKIHFITGKIEDTIPKQIHHNSPY